MRKSFAKALMFGLLLWEPMAWANCQQQVQGLRGWTDRYPTSFQLPFVVMIQQLNTKLGQDNQFSLSQFFKGTLNSHLQGSGLIYASDQEQDGEHFSGVPRNRGSLKLNENGARLWLPFPHGWHTLDQLHCFKTSHGFFFEGFISGTSPSTIVSISISQGRS
ncbi:hypothetical protein [Pseudobacteriovorax antillogorgiicola]|uniref:Uncharacterized protein n=1 Tax=Pseudobacteriovorax antillogorgiicola TaxID=1513793 RepID=A0A1Y6BYK3_9BACT|nr:hypothetical protein [Pseudobacteriovorax antillogorgiicola]TCS52959.1 hypothetical protein EDD56_10810 [Pseudobacteriovorax antillogorgiicola]SMF27519.1 hypothetical protein SAMN06296036_108237 [Pseudobacteriovorax antillogorgiicola]